MREVDMAKEGHGQECDCKSCVVDKEVQSTTKVQLVCTSCGKQILGDACAICACESCGAEMKPAK